MESFIRIYPKKMPPLLIEERTIIQPILCLSVLQLGEEVVATLEIALPDPPTAM
jgi:hypothetical protein